jgi:hypothetical protein
MGNIYDAEPDAVASVVYWSARYTKEEVDTVIQELMEKGMIEGHDTRKYTSAWGGPVFYIP